VTGPNPLTYCFGRFDGDPNPSTTSVAHGPNTAGTRLEYQTRTEREAFAIYTQSVYTFNEHFALTLGGRWARDQLHGEENVYYVGQGGEALLAGGPAFHPAGPGTPSTIGFVSQLGNVAIPLATDAQVGLPAGSMATICNAGKPTNAALLPLYGLC